MLTGAVQKKNCQLEFCNVMKLDKSLSDMVHFLFPFLSNIMIDPTAC